MNHLTNLYKNKCEQLQEQLYNFTRMLNEVAPPRSRPKVNAPGTPGTPGTPGQWVNPITSYGRHVQRNIKDVQNIFRNLPPDPARWLAEYNLLDYRAREYFFRLYGDIGGAGTTGLINVVIGDNTFQVRIMRESGPGNGRAGIFYWNTTSNSWVRFPTWQNVPGIGRNADYGVSYSKEWLNSLGRDVTIEARPDSTDVFSPASAQDFIGRGGLGDRIPDNDVGGGNIGGG